MKILDEPSLGEALAVAGRYAESLVIHEELVPLREEVLGPNENETLKSLQNLAYVYNKLDRVEDATATFEKVLPLVRESAGVANFMTLIVSKNLANAYTRTGREAEAIKLLRNVIDEVTPKLGTDNQHVANVVSQLAESLSVAGQLETETEFLDQWRPVMEKKLNVAPFSPRFLMLHGEAQQASDNNQAALQTFTMAYEGFVATINQLPVGERKWLPELAERIAQLHDEAGDPDAAADWKAKAETHREEK